MFKVRKFLSAKELQAELDNWSDDEEMNGRIDAVDIAIIPPDVAEVSDLEDFDEDEHVIGDENNMIQEVAGNYEVEYTYEKEPQQKETQSSDDDELLQAKRIRVTKPKKSGNTTAAPADCFKKPIWSRDGNYLFPKQPIDNSEVSHKELFEKIGEFKKFVVLKITNISKN